MARPHPAIHGAELREGTHAFVESWEECLLRTLSCGVKVLTRHAHRRHMLPKRFDIQTWDSRLGRGLEGQISRRVPLVVLDMGVRPRTKKMLLTELTWIGHVFA